MFSYDRSYRPDLHYAVNPGLLNNADGSGLAAGDDNNQYDPELADMAGMATEALEDNSFREMGFSIEKTIVEAKGRALKAQYSLELAQDLRAIHGLDAEAELANIPAAKSLLRSTAKLSAPLQDCCSGAANNVANAGVFDLDVDGNGRWSVEKFKGLLFQLERDCNAIAQNSSRKGQPDRLFC